jgi:hypothetical protein
MLKSLTKLLRYSTGDMTANLESMMSRFTPTSHQSIIEVLNKIEPRKVCPI